MSNDSNALLVHSDYSFTRTYQVIARAQEAILLLHWDCQRTACRKILTVAVEKYAFALLLDNELQENILLLILCFTLFSFERL